MEFSTAVRLIKKGILKSETPQHWADLGAGDGFFTCAVGSLLPARSSILAIDQNASTLKSFEWDYQAISLQRKTGNFTSLDWPDNLDGILMANSMHYVKDQSHFLFLLRSKLSASGRLLIVEYDRKQDNQWVPYPIDFEMLKRVGEKSGFSSVEKLEEASSIYGGTIIYSALLTQ